jgi:hypothetical protein
MYFFGLITSRRRASKGIKHYLKLLRIGVADIPASENEHPTKRYGITMG